MILSLTAFLHWYYLKISPHFFTKNLNKPRLISKVIGYFEFNYKNIIKHILMLKLTYVRRTLH